MFKKSIVYCLFLFLLFGCVEKSNSISDLSELSYMLAFTSQFGDSSELVGVSNDGKNIYDNSLDFGGIVSITEKKNDIEIYTYEDVYTLSSQDDALKEEKIKTEVFGSPYRGTFTTYKENQFFSYNQGFGDPYYKSAVFRNGEEFISIEGTITDFGFHDNMIYVLYSHTAMISSGVCDFRIDYYDLDTKERIDRIELPLINQYSNAVGKIINNVFYIYAFSAHDATNLNSSFISVDLSRKTIDEIALGEVEQTKLENQSRSYVLNCFLLNHEIYLIQENGDFIRWNPEQNAISIDVLKDHESKYTSVYKVSADDHLVRIGYDEEKLCIYKYNMKQNEVVAKNLIDYTEKRDMVLYDFIILNE